MAEVCWRSYFLSVGVILPLTAVLSAAWMEVDPVSWVGGVGGRGKRKKKIRVHSSGGTASPHDKEENPSKPRRALPLHKLSASL